MAAVTTVGVGVVFRFISYFHIFMNGIKESSVFMETNGTQWRSMLVYISLHNSITGIDNKTSYHGSC